MMRKTASICTIFISVLIVVKTTDGTLSATKVQLFAWMGKVVVALVLLFIIILQK